MIRQVVYVSTARAGAGDAELHGIVDKARAANGRNGLTGILAAGNGVYLHDGTEGLHLPEIFEDLVFDYDTLLTRLRADSRHENLRILQDIEVAARNFPGRLMGLRVLAPEAPGLIAAQLRLRPMSAAEIVPALGNPAAAGLSQVALAA